MRLKSILLASVVLASVPGFASAEPNEAWYVELGAGANWLDDIDDALEGPLGPDHYAVDFDTGWVLQGSAGYNWDPIRIELELAYRSNDTDTVAFNFGGAGALPLVANPAASGDVSTFSEMINLIFDIPLGDSVSVSLGGGVGGALVDFDIGGHIFPLTDFRQDDDDYVFAYQGIAGLSIDVGERTELYGEYRYFVASDVSISGNYFFPAATAANLNGFDLENHTALIGLRYYFGEEAAATPVVEEPPPAAQTNYTIDFGKKGVLTADAQATLTEAAEAHKGGAPVVTIEAQGGGPRTGEVVTRALTDLGVPAEKIAVAAHGDGATITITQ